jgi:chloride channel protein, CIC family
MREGTPEASGAPAAREDDGQATSDVVSAARPVHPYIHVVIVAIVGAVSVLAWLVVFEEVNRLLWENDVVTANPWLFPVICLPFSLLVGLLVKYRHAPTNLDESLLDSLSGDPSRIDWRGLPVNVVMAWASLFSGAVLGPEGGIGGIGSKIAAFYGERVGIPAEHRSRLVFATLASAYNGLIANPLFTGVLGMELEKDPASRSRNLPANLIGGSIGFFIFLAVGSTGLQDYLHLAAGQPYQPVDLVLVVVFGLVGLVLAIVAGALMRAAAAVFGRFEGREVERALVAGVVFSAVGIVAPILLFSGETQIKTVVADPAAYGPAVLVAMALVKLALLAVAFKSGFLGGPTFPAIFASTCVALAVGLLFPGIPLDVLIGGVMAGFLMVLFKAPFMVILLTAVMLQATPEMIGLIVLAVAAVMIVQPYLMAAMASRQAARLMGRPGARPSAS